MSKKAEKIIKEVNATMSLEGMPLSDFDIELISKIIDGEITREEAFKIFNASIGRKKVSDFFYFLFSFA